MSLYMTIALLLGAAATLVFVLGYVKGTTNAIRNHQSGTQPAAAVADAGESSTWKIAFAVLAAAALIGLIGVSPSFFYLPPLLVIGTAAVNGFAFFFDKDG